MRAVFYVEAVQPLSGRRSPVVARVAIRGAVLKRAVADQKNLISNTIEDEFLKKLIGTKLGTHVMGPYIICEYQNSNGKYYFDSHMTYNINHIFCTRGFGDIGGRLMREICSCSQSLMSESFSASSSPLSTSTRLMR